MQQCFVYLILIPAKQREHTDTEFEMKENNMIGKKSYIFEYIFILCRTLVTLISKAAGPDLNFNTFTPCNYGD